MKVNSNKTDLDKKREEERRKLRRKFQMCLPLGALVLLLALLCKQFAYLSDFTIGFLEGIAIALLVPGVGYLIWCKVKKEKPFE